ncbi:hypothetical protein AWW68_01375 [Roseivirga spongicola]|uniref:Lipocalin-like domain-containing protein n=2 Tax=Roseivirgaceae TaxID=2762306 RepID=A0A150XFE0_9BACT|nr:hypothetical protein AWW68_01375 [Roseivirga spongicola]
MFDLLRQTETNMKKHFLFWGALVFLFSAYGCADDAYLFTDKEEQAKLANHQQALVGQWVLESENDTELVMGIKPTDSALTLLTPTGEAIIESIKPLGDLGLVLELRNGESSDRIMAKFKSYQKTTLVLMTVQGVNLGIEAEVPMTFKKLKEEAVLTASSNDK